MPQTVKTPSCMRENSDFECAAGIDSSAFNSRRSACIAIVLSIEITLTATVFQHAGKLELPNGTTWWIRALAQPDLLTRIFLTSGVALLFFCGKDLLRSIRSNQLENISLLSSSLLMLFHFLCAVGVAVTSQLAERLPIDQLLPLAIRPSLWIFCFSGLIGSIALFLLPLSDWRHFVQNNKSY